MSPEEFEKTFGREFAEETVDMNPYGTPTHPVKTGLTKRGKAVLAIGATVIAGGSLIGYQAYSADAAANEAKTQELAVKAQALELEKLKELNRASEAQRKTQTSENKARQASVDKCVNSKEDLVGKGLGAPTYRDVIDACQAQYVVNASSDDMQAAASQQTASTTDGGGVNQGLLIGGGVLAVFLVAAAKKGTRSNPA